MHTGNIGEDVVASVAEVAADFAKERSQRGSRSALDGADFEKLAAAGYLKTGVPVSAGGIWVDGPTTIPQCCRMARALGAADPSLALVTTMHPAVLAFWLFDPVAPAPYTSAWAAQRQSIFDGVLSGAWWGTIASEPGSGGDLSDSRVVAAPTGGGGYTLTGDKHMGSGSGITSFMLTVGRPKGEEETEVFLMDVRDAKWDGSTGMKLVRQWDGYGMMATQSHAFRFDDYPVTRFAWPGRGLVVVPQVMPLVLTLFTSVTLGILDAAMSVAKTFIERAPTSLRPIERVSWVRAENQYWLAQQAWDGVLRAISASDRPDVAAARGKLVVAELAESVLEALSKSVGAKTFSRSLPFGQWTQDVRALGFLRPPWG